MTCTLGDPDGHGEVAAVDARVKRDLGPLATTAGKDGSITVDAGSMAAANDQDRLGWAVAHWAVAVSSPLQVVEVDHMGRRWQRSTGKWTPVDGTPGAAGQVRIVLAP